MTSALIAVDVQSDFLPGGALEAPDGEKIIEPLVKLAEEVDYVIASRDWHPEKHISFKKDPKFEDMSWPVHCVQDTPGAEIEPHIAKVADVIVSKGTETKKEAYSAFEGTVDNSGETLSEWLSGNGVDHVIVGGLVDEFCVKATAIDAVKEGFRTTLNLHAAAGLGPETAKDAIKEMGAAGVHISEREPRGERAATRDEALRDFMDDVSMEISDADREGNERLIGFYKQLMVAIRNRATDDGTAFTVVYPTFTLDIRFVEFPEAQVRIEG